MATPNYNEPFIIQTDASDVGIGGVLLQGSGEDERAVAYFSQKLSSTQRKYQTTERECLAVIVGIEKFRPYIEGAHFTVITDHASLQWLQNLKDPSGRLGRWALRLQPYDFSLIHRPGRQMVVADALSRAVELIDEADFGKTSDRWYLGLIKRVKEEPEKLSQYRVEGDLLFKYCSYRPHQIDQPTWRLVVPTEKRTDVLRACHDDPLSAHGGRHKTIDRVSRQYYWPKMYASISTYVRNCEVCRATKSSNVTQRAPMGEQLKVDRPWQAIYIDFVGPFPRSKSGFVHLFVAVDAFTKFVNLHPMRVATTKGVVSFLEKNIFLLFGVPERVISDNGSQFTSHEYRAFLESYQVEATYVSRYHPQANAAEAANKTIGAAIRAYVKDNHREWDKYIPKIACAMNTATHSSTSLSPYFANFGYHMRLAGKQIGDLEPRNEIGESHFREIREVVRKQLEKSHEASKRVYDLRSRQRTFAIGDIVWKRTFPLSDASRSFAAKLAPKYQKCIVNKKVGNSSYELATESGKILGVFSAKDIKQV